MKRIVLILAAALVLSSCSGMERPETMSPTSNFRQLLTAILHKNVRLTDQQIKGISGEGYTVAEAVADSQRKGLGALLQLALDDKTISKLGYVLTVTPQGQKTPVEVVCPPELALRCSEIPVNTPVMVWAIPVPVEGGLLLARRVTT